MSNKDVALKIAFDNYTSSVDGVTPTEAMALSEEDWNEKVQVWQPFENMPHHEILENIEDLADDIEEALEEKECHHGTN